MKILEIATLSDREYIGHFMERKITNKEVGLDMKC